MLAAAVPVLKFKASGFFIGWLHDRILKTFFRNPDSTCFQFTPVIMYTVGWISLSAELAKVHVGTNINVVPWLFHSCISNLTSTVIDS